MTICKRALLAALPIMALAVLGSACSSSTKNANSSSSASQSSIDDLTARVQRHEMLNAWVIVSALPVHDLDDELQGGNIDGKYVPTLRTLIRVLALTDWTSDLKPAMTKYHDDAVALLQALEAGKTADETKGLSDALHEDAHGFSPAVGNVIAKDLPPNAGGPQPTPTPDATAGGATPAH